MIKQEETRKPAMIITLAIDGEVIDVTKADHTPVQKGELPAKPVKVKKLVGHAVLSSEMNPTCITYSTPGGVWTV